LGQWDSAAHVGVAPDLTTVAVGDAAADRIELIHVSTRKVTHELAGYMHRTHSRIVLPTEEKTLTKAFAPTFSPDGRWLLAARDSGQGREENALRFWETATGKRLPATLNGHELILHHSAFSPDGRLLAVLRSDGRLGVRDSRSLRLRSTPAAVFTEMSTPPVF